MAVEFIIIIIVTRYLRKSLDTPNSLPEWDKWLNWAMYAAIVLMVMGLANSPIKVAIQFIAHLMVSGLIYILAKEKSFRSARFILIAITPYIILTILSDLIELINKPFFKEWGELIGITIFFAFIWGVGTWWITNKQRKALEKEKTKTKEEEQQNRIVTAMKAQLEVQVAERTAELTQQKEELQLALNELRNTQAQLIQAEKMASLGELTAGIAHEIQNPLNFINNFSEVNTDLIEEMNVEMKKGNTGEVELIATDLKQNLEKIIFHGKRADGIVKGMLMHSRKSTGQKEPTDINALADEYLRLSYHGLRAKDKSFNASFATDLDSTIAPINVIPQDIGRVLLNLYNNAFYAVTEKKKRQKENYNPTVSVSTKQLDDKVEIRVKDNGDGIPQHIADKIFQPFFTTKPTGQGTGLGLSLSYDIITKAHGGTLQVNTAEGEGAEFIIQLPYKS